MSNILTQRSRGRKRKGAKKMGPFLTQRHKDTEAQRHCSIPVIWSQRLAPDEVKHQKQKLDFGMLCRLEFLSKSHICDKSFQNILPKDLLDSVLGLIHFY
jgi:hypothetical protein